MNKITLTIDRVENGVAVLKKGKELINFPVKYLLNGAKEGDVLNFAIYADKEKAEADKNTAKELLNEIINGSN